MKDEELLELLGALAVEQDEGPLDPRWERLARGELSAAERAALLSEEGVTGQDITPLGADFTEDMTAQLLAQRRPVRRLWPLAPVLLALAAALMLWVRSPNPVDFPAYTSTLSGDVDTMRAETPSSGVPVFTARSQLTLTLRPDVDVAASFACSAWFRQPSGTLVSWPCTSDNISAAGAVRISGLVGSELALPIGQQELVVILHPPGALVETVARQHAAGDEADWPVFIEPLEVVE